MVKVAVAGGSNGVGRQIVEALNATGRHEVLVLSRNYDPTPFKDHANVTGISVDYNSHISLVQALTGVHTVLCTFFISGTGVGSTNVASQCALVRAAAEARVQRFAPSEYGGNPGDQPEKNKVREEIAKFKELETTIFMNGLFMNYFAGERNTSHLKHISFIVDPHTHKATEIPGTGNEPMVFTLVEDVASFVVATIELPPGKWPELSGMVGARTSYNEVVRTLEKVQGVKYEVGHRSVELVRTLETFVDHLGVAIIDGIFDIPDTSNKLFPEIKAKGLEEFLTEVWG